MKLPIRTLGLAAAALLIGSALAPVSAQSQQSGLDGQVALRSDGALYLISNGQRRWIATAAASDEEINALPEGEPILAGLALAGSAAAPAAQAAPAKPTANQSGTTNTSATKNAPTQSTSSNNDNSTTSSSGGDGEFDSSLPIQVDLEGETEIERGDSRKVEIKTNKNVTCELRVQVPDDDDIEEDSKNADSGGRCKYTIEIPKGTKEGKGKIIGTVREGGKVNRQEVGITIAD
jgi:hypothetical protein